jgi:hypothetical protein
LRLHPAQARRDVAAAHVLDTEAGDLPSVGVALAAGEITREHADVCVRVAANLPRRLTRALDPQTGRSGMALADAFLVEQARTQGPGTTRWLGEQLVAVLAPNPIDRLDPEAHLRRGLTFGTDSTGMLVGRFSMDAADGAMSGRCSGHWRRRGPQEGGRTSAGSRSSSPTTGRRRRGTSTP